MNKTAKALEGQATEKTQEKNPPEINETLKKLLSGEDVFEVVETSRGKFTMKFPRPRTLRQIQILLSQRFLNTDLSKLPRETVRFYEVYATLDVVVIKAPSWWDDLDSAEDCPDDNFIADLYRRYLRFYNRVQSEIAGTGKESGAGGEEGVNPGKEASVGDGPFSGLTHGQEVPGPK